MLQHRCEMYMAEIGVIYINKRQKCNRHKNAKKHTSKSRLRKLLLGLGVLGVTVFGGSVLSITVFNFNVNFNTENITNVHNNVTDSFRSTHRVDEAGNSHYTVHPSRYGSLRHVDVEIVEGQSTTVLFYSNPITRIATGS